MKIKQHLYIVDQSRFLKGDYISCFHITDCNDLNIDNWLYVGEIDVDIDVDNLSFEKSAVSDIDIKIKEIKEIKCELDAELKELELSRKNLLCPEYTGES